MTNFVNPKPYIGKKKTYITKQAVDKKEAIKIAVKIIRENKRIVGAAMRVLNENPHR